MSNPIDPSDSTHNPKNVRHFELSLSPIQDAERRHAPAPFSKVIAHTVDYRTSHDLKQDQPSSDFVPLCAKQPASSNRLIAGENLSVFSLRAGAGIPQSQ